MIDNCTRELRSCVNYKLINVNVRVSRANRDTKRITMRHKILHLTFVQILIGRWGSSRSLDFSWKDLRSTADDTREEPSGIIRNLVCKEKKKEFR